MKNNQINCKQDGFTMVEVLVAMTLGIIVLGATIGMQITHQSSFKITDNKLFMQTNARFAFEFISNSMRELGAAGCRTVGSYQNIGGAEGDTMKTKYHIGLISEIIPFADFRAENEILGYENTATNAWTPSVPADFTFISKIIDGSDAITLRGALGPTYRVDSSDLSTGSIQLNLANISRISLKPKQYAVLSQCDRAEVFKVTGTDAQVAAGLLSHTSGTLGDDNRFDNFGSDGNGFNYDSRSVAEVRRVAVVSYYIANNDNNVPTLYRDIDNISDPLVEGVEKMQIEYGVDNNSATYHVPDVYHNADWVSANGQWANVVSVRVSFIMRSKRAVYDEAGTNTYKLPGASVYSYTPNDNFARLVYTSTINLRNRTLNNRTN